MSSLAHLVVCLIDSLADVQRAAHDTPDTSDEMVARWLCKMQAVSGMLYAHPAWPGDMARSTLERARAAAKREVMEHFEDRSGREHLAQTCVEAVGAAAKLLRFDLVDHAPRAVTQNWEDLVCAVEGVFAVAGVLQGDEGERYACLPRLAEATTTAVVAAKQAKTERFMDYSAERGAVLVDAD